MKKIFKRKDNKNAADRTGGIFKRLREKLVPDRQAVRASFGTVTFRHGTYSAAAIALVIVIAVAVNLIVGQLPESVKEADISSNDVYEISDVSKKILKNLEDEITITVVAEEDSVDDMLTTFLEKYSSLSDKVSVETADPVLHPSVLEEYDTESDTVVVQCEETGLSQSVSISDILVQDMYSYYSTGSSSVSSFDADGQITSAISKVTGQETKKAYYVTGHGESELGDSITSLMTKSGITAEELQLYMTEEIPDDCDVLIFNGLTSDISKGEKSAVNSYIKGGGSVVMLMADDSPTSGNLASLLSSYLITLEDGYVADMERNYLGNYYAIFPEITDSTGITGDLATGTVMLNNSRAFTLGESSEETTVEAIMQTSDYGYLVSTDSDDDESQEEGTFVTGAAATYTATDDTSDEDTDSEDDESSTVTGSLIVFGSQSLIDESITASFSNLDNESLFMNTMTSGMDDVQNLAIEAKSLQVQYNTVQNGGAISIFLIFVIPAAFLVVGFIFWYRRRKA